LDRIATACGERRYSLFTGDLGTALFAAACLDVDARFPVIDVMYPTTNTIGAAYPHAQCDVSGLGWASPLA
jgi:hypothetical protein